MLVTAGKLAALAINAYARNCQATGNTVFCDDGVSYQRNGNTTFGSDGSSSQRIGDTIHNSNGTSCQIVGNQTYCN